MNDQNEYVEVPGAIRREVVRVLRVCRKCGQATRIERLLPPFVEQIGEMVERPCACAAEGDSLDPRVLNVILNGRGPLTSGDGLPIGFGCGVILVWLACLGAALLF